MYRSSSSAAVEVACNWKIAIENYLECYHCQVAHPAFSAVVDVRPDAYRLKTHPLGSSQFGPTKRKSGPVEDSSTGCGR